jgi:ribosomal protein S6--L-glutamate ligase
LEDFKDFITEKVIDKNLSNNDGYCLKNEEQDNIHLIILTGSKSDDDESVVNRFMDTAKKMGQSSHRVVVGAAWVAEFDLETNTMVIMNYDDKGKSIKINTENTIVIARAAAFMGENSEIGKAMLQAFQSSGCFMLNDLQSSILCDNKFLSYIKFSRNSIPIPKTALIPTEKAIENAHERIGGKFPVVVKTLSGTQGIGVSIVESMQSLVSVVQSLRKYKADLLIQEFIKLDYDVRTLVLGGRIIACTRRNKVPDDFRSNAHLGAKTEPYVLSDDEEEVVKATARISGATLVGVDHCLVDKEIYVLECNASPGVGANYHNYDIKTVPQKKKKMKGDQIDDIFSTIIDYLRYRSNRNLTSFTECGYKEQVRIKGCGNFIAKFDTGNGSIASMKKVDKVKIDGKIAKWELDGKKYAHEIVDWSEPRVADGREIGKRPCVLVDVEFNNRTYINIPIALEEEANSDLLVNRNLMEIFKVSVNPSRKFVLSEWKKQSEKYCLKQ